MESGAGRHVIVIGSQLRTHVNLDQDMQADNSKVFFNRQPKLQNVEVH